MRYTREVFDEAVKLVLCTYEAVQGLNTDLDEAFREDSSISDRYPNLASINRRMRGAAGYLSNLFSALCDPGIGDIPEDEHGKPLRLNKKARIAVEIVGIEPCYFNKILFSVDRAMQSGVREGIANYREWLKRKADKRAEANGRNIQTRDGMVVEDKAPTLAASATPEQGTDAERIDISAVISMMEAVNAFEELLGRYPPAD